MKITKDKVWGMLQAAQARGIDIGVSSNAAGITITNNKESIHYTERLTPKEAYLYLSGVCKGVDLQRVNTFSIPSNK